MNLIFFIDLPRYLESYSIQIALSSLHLLKQNHWNQNTITDNTLLHSFPLRVTTWNAYI